MTAACVLALAVTLAGSGCSLLRPHTCESLQELSANVRGLSQLNLVQTGTDGLAEQLEKIEQSWNKVLRSAGSQFGEELKRLQATVETLTATLQEGTSGRIGLDEFISRLQQEVAAVEDAWKSLTTAVASELSDCDLG
jgi:predicted nuclease with TOPRIM domain